jgi:hypothetical protein
MCRIRTLEENSSTVQGVTSEGKIVAMLAHKEFFKGSVESSMEPTLGQSHKDETCSVINHDTTRLLPCKFLQSKRR